jgi:uncharacterized repeat protein (TIGR01451 family)
LHSKTEDYDVFTRLAQRKRPRRPAFLLITASAIASLLVAAVALAVLVTDAGTYSVEVTSKEDPALSVSVGAATVTYIPSAGANESSGTGLFDPFVRLQGSPTEKGYNTDGTVEFQTKTGKWTHAILASAIPVVDCDGVAGGATCWELFVDINEGNNAKHISLTDVEIYFATGPAGNPPPASLLTGYPFTSPPAGITVTKEYDFDGEIKINDVNQGSGRGDLQYLVPTTDHPFTASTYFVLYSEWGSPDAAPGGDTYNSEGGFEEWKVRKAPNVTIVKTADAVSVNAGQNIGFTITVTNNGAADATGVTITDLLPPGTGIDWSEAPVDNPNCSISGSPPAETLNCGPVTLAAGGGSLSVHVQSATTGASCGTYNNTANFTSTNAGSGSASASTSVDCAAIMILKQSTKTVGGNPVLVANDGTVFSITGPGGYSNSVTDDDASGVEDEDATVGEVCISGLVPGEYTISETTPPSGYGAGTAIDATATAASGTNCTTNQPTPANSAVFRNPPLAEIQVLVTDLGSGETNSSIVCAEGTTTIPAVSENGNPDPAFDDTDETFTNLDPGTYTCTVVIDP